jgi:ribosome recycling factor
MNMNDTEASIKRSLDLTLQNLNVTMAGTINPEVVGKIAIHVQGVPTTLNNAAIVSRPSATSIQIKPFDRLTLREIEKALAYVSQVGVTIINDGETVTLNFPPFTAERKRDLLRFASSCAEKGHRQIKALGEESIEMIKIEEEEGTISAAQSSSQQAAVTALMMRQVARIDEHLAAIVNRIKAG